MSEHEKEGVSRQFWWTLGAGIAVALVGCVVIAVGGPDNWTTIAVGSSAIAVSLSVMGIAAELG